MKSIKLSLVAALAATTFAVAGNASEIGVSANMAIASNYVWRGMTQNKNSPAIQGGIDLDYNNFYAGVWGSNVNFGDNSSLEGDVYAGYASTLAGIDYDLGFVEYTYANESKGSNFGEAYASLSKDFGVVAVGLKGSYGVTTNDFDPTSDVEASVSVPLPSDISFDGVVGKYNQIGVYYSAGLTKTFGKFDISAAYTGMDHADDGADAENNFVATIATSF